MLIANKRAKWKLIYTINSKHSKYESIVVINTYNANSAPICTEYVNVYRLGAQRESKSIT